MDCKIIQIITPKRITLDGLWFGHENPETVLIFIHGLGGNIFSTGQRLLTPLVNNKTAILFFNNRGHDGITRIKKIDKRKKSGTTSILGGMMHEVFTDSVDDIQGAVTLAKKAHAKHIFLVGHSTGAQKSVYYASKNQKDISGLILLSPLSDYAGILKQTDPEILKTAEKAARALVANNTPHALLPLGCWSYPIDAQRFLSLFTPDSTEEIFCYATKRKPTTLRKIRLPTLILLGEKDEFRDRPIRLIAKWFEKHLKSLNKQVAVIPKDSHSFTENELLIQRIITFWIKSVA